jgi:hypothetical protein
MELDLRDVKPSVLSWFVIGISAVTFIVTAKWFVTQFKNPVTDMLRDTILAI